MKTLRCTDNETAHSLDLLNGHGRVRVNWNDDMAEFGLFFRGELIASGARLAMVVAEARLEVAERLGGDI
jgi:hypothetical protein